MLVDLLPENILWVNCEKHFGVGRGYSCLRLQKLERRMELIRNKGGQGLLQSSRLPY